MRKLKRLLAAVLAAAMLATFLPAGALAVEENENTAPPSNQAVDTEEPGEKPADSEPDGEVPEIEEIGFTVGGDYIKAEEVSTQSLQPLDVKNYTLNLQGYLPSELKAVQIDTNFTSKLTPTSGSDAASNTPGDYKVWARWGYADEDGYHYDEDADYAVLNSGDTVDLSVKWGFSEYYNYTTYTLEMIVGTADQLDTTNKRYIVAVQTTNGLSELLEFKLTDQNDDPVGTVYDPYWQTNSYSNDVLGYYQLSVLTKNWSNGNFKLSLDFDSNSPWSRNRGSGNGLTDKYDVKVYAGHYTKAENLPGTDITTQIWKSSATGYATSSESSWDVDLPLTMVLYQKGTDTVADILPFDVKIYQADFGIYFNNLYEKSGNSYYSAGNARNTRYTDDRDFTVTYRLHPGNKINGSNYYVRLNSNDPETDKSGVENINHAYVGRLTPDEVTAKGSNDDIKNDLFPNSSNQYQAGGYAVDFANYSNGITFTVLDSVDSGNLWYITIKVEEQEEVKPSVPSSDPPLSADVYFRMNGAYKATITDSTPSPSGYNAYVLPYEHDTYYHRGYQTIFLLDENSDGTAKALGDSTKIYPQFWTHDSVDVYAGKDVDGFAQSGAKLESGKYEVKFENGVGSMYSAAAENDRHLKNYFVTFLTQTDKPTLFVNGMNDENNFQPDPKDKDKPEDQQAKMFARVVNLTSDYHYFHDIFFANLGKTALKNLKVELVGANGTGEAQNVALDDYWTINNKNGAKATTLGAFDSTAYTGEYSELSNVGKLRLVPTEDEDGNMNSGEISGRLIITYDGDSGKTETIEILLTGTAGQLKIITDDLLPAVQHVSYSSLIQTNYLTDGAADAVRFTATGLPGGMQIKENGELYGVPTQVGTFPITITATCTETVNGQTVTRTDTKGYDLVIADNSDDNVWKYDQTHFNGDTTYTPTIGIPNEGGDTSNLGIGATAGNNSWESEWQEIYCAGNYDYFLDRVFLDSQPLTPGVDYTSRDGSTRITIRTQTLRSRGNGTHTIDAEFRKDKDESQTLRRTAQNYTLTTLGVNNSQSSGSNGGGSSSGSDTRYNIDTTIKVSNGSCTVAPDKAAEGALVTITLSPAYGYELDQVIVTDQSGKQIKVNKAGNNKYTFFMPNSKVDVKPIFKLKEYTPGVNDSPFVDVDPNAWYANAVNYVYEKGLMVGVGGHSFRPNTITERCMIVTVLYNLEGHPDNVDSYFTDVPSSQWYAKPVFWAAESGIISGYGDGRFGPDDDLTREQMVVILYNYAKLKGYDVSQQDDLSQFKDADSVSAFARPALQWASAVGLINGIGNGVLNPGGNATRAQLATVLMKFCEKIVK